MQLCEPIHDQSPYLISPSSLSHVRENIFFLDLRDFSIREEELPDHLVFVEAQICARRQNFLQEFVHRPSSRFALFSGQHFGLVVGRENQAKCLGVEAELEHEQLPILAQLILQAFCLGFYNETAYRYGLKTKKLFVVLFNRGPQWVDQMLSQAIIWPMGQRLPNPYLTGWHYTPPLYEARQ